MIWFDLLKEKMSAVDDYLADSTRPDTADSAFELERALQLSEAPPLLSTPTDDDSTSTLTDGGTKRKEPKRCVECKALRTRGCTMTFEGDLVSLSRTRSSLCFLC